MIVFMVLTQVLYFGLCILTIPSKSLFVPCLILACFLTFIFVSYFAFVCLRVFNLNLYLCLPCPEEQIKEINVRNKEVNLKSQLKSRHVQRSQLKEVNLKIEVNLKNNKVSFYKVNLKYKKRVNFCIFSFFF